MPKSKRPLRCRCDRCDGCGWIEGGYEQPVCPICKGEGMVSLETKRTGKPAPSASESKEASHAE